MVGGGNRRDEGSFKVSNSNVFAALDTLRKKKKSDKEKGSSKGGKSASKGVTGKSKDAEEKKVFWAPAPLTVKSWADVDDEDDDDYYATTAPPQAIWGGSGLNKGGESDGHEPVEESESEDELLDEGGDDVEEEHDHEPEVQEKPEPVVEKPVEASPAPKETERQLSKKERRKKELAELEAILADFGVNQPKENTEDEPSADIKDGKEGQPNGNADKKEDAPAESKSAKKKKKKDKTSKESKEPQEEIEQQGHGEEDAPVIDVKEKLKKVASTKKKKSNKEMDAAAKAAAQEAAARRAKLAAAKKKEKSHYNQQPIR